MRNSSESHDQQVLPRLTQAIKMSSVLAEKPIPEPVAPLLEQVLGIPASIITQSYLWPVCSATPRQAS